ncbi:hypothetical protein PHLGIDRAFT_17446 [Phlebiopsis gigantea 11061_1 CR5-6]|uniref:Uncharacterized protein n=1 Tax=Phlebiopsis gigantea (strain 11061_1 CR5-6) TaxID=745531 RepID=A0A0C3RY91_PHLG1|nr:hypothetical protein PHLGIDRAFT_17446 [Phlebiopsis gigantea 11061_1 CR5-6]
MYRAQKMHKRVLEVLVVCSQEAWDAHAGGATHAVIRSTVHEGGGVPRVKGYVPDARSHITVDFKARDTTVPMADWAIVDCTQYWIIVWRIVQSTHAESLTTHADIEFYYNSLRDGDQE